MSLSIKTKTQVRPDGPQPGGPGAGAEASRPPKARETVYLNVTPFDDYYIIEYLGKNRALVETLRRNFKQYEFGRWVTGIPLTTPPDKAIEQLKATLDGDIEIVFMRHPKEWERVIEMHKQVKEARERVAKKITEYLRHKHPEILKNAVKVYIDTYYFRHRAIKVLLATRRAIVIDAKELYEDREFLESLRYSYTNEFPIIR
jgi:hypothetical protein